MSAALTSACLLQSSLTTSRFPAKAAICRGVQPFCAALLQVGYLLVLMHLLPQCIISTPYLVLGIYLCTLLEELLTDIRMIFVGCRMKCSPATLQEITAECLHCMET